MTDVFVRAPRPVRQVLSLVLSLLASFILSSSPAAALSSATPAMRVTLDPGHGGSDNGAARGTIKEKEIALKVSLMLAALLKADSRFKVSMTRTNDRKIPLAKRTLIAEDAKADVFLSIHLNSSTDSKARGTEIYFQNQLPADEEAMYLVSKEAEGAGDEPIEEIVTKSEPISVRTDLKRILEDLHRNQRIRLSADISKVLIETVAAKNNLGRRTIRQAPFQVVTNTTIPSVLVELGFITNPLEGPRLAQDDYQHELAETLYHGLVKYKETVDKTTTANLHSAQ